MPLEKYIRHVLIYLLSVCVKRHQCPQTSQAAVCSRCLKIPAFTFIYIYTCGVINIIDHTFLFTQVFCLNVLRFPPYI